MFSGGGRAQIQGESDMHASTRVGGNLRDGLALRKSHSYRLPREKVVVSRLKEPELLSSQGVMKELQDGAQCYIVFTHLEVEKRGETSMIPVVHEFEDVFSEEVSGLPPSKEVEFTIDLVLGTGLVSMAPYRMAPTKLVELKSQIEELLGKQFIRPSTSPWGAQ